MGEIRCGTRGTCPPIFLDSGDIICHSPHVFLFKFCIWRDFKNESDVGHLLCEKLFMLYIRHSQIDAETEFDVVSLIPIFLQILASIK